MNVLELSISSRLVSHTLNAGDGLVLSPICLADAAQIQQLADDPDIAANTLNIRHPLPADWAREWIENHEQHRLEGRGITFCIRRQCDPNHALPIDETVMGVVSLLEISRVFENAELAYWLGRPYRGFGYATEAARLVLAFGFGTLALHRIYAFYLSHNLNSARVLERIGMRHEGELRHHIKKDGIFVNSGIYGLLAQEFEA